MNHIIMSLLLGLTLFYQGPLTQSPESDETTYHAYLDNQNVSLLKESWKKAVQSRKEECEKSPGDYTLRYKLALTQFGLLSMTMRDQDEELFDAYADQTEQNLETLLSENKNWAEPRALLSAVYGLRMGYSPWQGMFLGPKSQSLMDKAMEDGPGSPLVWKLFANSRYFTPEMWGGDLEEAIKAYEKSIHLFESDPSKTNFNWYYIDTLAFLGQAYSKNGESAKAIAQYEKALQIEGEFYWVKYVLLPKAKKELTQVTSK